jgi:tRNA A37 N6-isopentenylltransferase MiaA
VKCLAKSRRKIRLANEKERNVLILSGGTVIYIKNMTK